jgi:hypothetical protein
MIQRIIQHLKRRMKQQAYSCASYIAKIGINKDHATV